MLLVKVLYTLPQLFRAAVQGASTFTYTLLASSPIMQRPCSMHFSAGALLPKGRGLAGRPARAPACLQTVKCSAATVGAPSLRRQGARPYLHAALLHTLAYTEAVPVTIDQVVQSNVWHLKRCMHVCAEILTPGDEGVIIIGAGIGGLATAAALHKVRCSSEVVSSQGRRPARAVYLLSGILPHSRWAFLRLCWRGVRSCVRRGPPLACAPPLL